MPGIEFMQVVFGDERDYFEHCMLLNFDDEFVLTDKGILIDSSGKLIWRAKLEHEFTRAVYIKEKEIIVTNRLICIGACGPVRLGVACVDIKTGKYRWKHFYDKYTSRISFKNGKPDINMVRRLGEIDIDSGCINCDGFEVNLDDGDYKYTEEWKSKKSENHGVVYPERMESIGECIKLYPNDLKRIQLHIDFVYLDDLKFSKRDYFFKKCDFYIPSNDNIYFFGVPAKKNTKNAILFKYSKIHEEVIEEIELPFRYAPDSAYDFGNGTLFILRNSIWFVKGL